MKSAILCTALRQVYILFTMRACVCVCFACVHTNVYICMYVCLCGKVISHYRYSSSITTMVNQARLGNWFVLNRVYFY